MATRLELTSDHKTTLNAVLHLPDESARSNNSWKEMAGLSSSAPFSHQHYDSLPVPDIYKQTSTTSNRSAMINEVAGLTFVSLGGSVIGNGFTVRDLAEREGSSSLARGFALSIGIESAELTASTMLAKNHDFLSKLFAPNAVEGALIGFAGSMGTSNMKIRATGVALAWLTGRLVNAVEQGYEQAHQGFGLSSSCIRKSSRLDKVSNR